jgi:aspartyl protease family protein
MRNDELPGTFKIVVLWLIAGTAVFLGFQWYQHEQAKTRFSAVGDVIEIRRGDDGHYHWPGTINGQGVDFLVDTGATGTAIPSRLARELRLETEGKARASTAGGTVVGEIARADIALEGGVRVDRLRVMALPGLSGSPLLGMDVLGRLQWQQQGGVLRIDLRSGTGSNR